MVAAFLAVDGFVQTVANSDALDFVGTLAFVWFLVCAFLASVLVTWTVAPDPGPSGSDLTRGGRVPQEEMERRGREAFPQHPELS